VFLIEKYNDTDCEVAISSFK